MRTKKTVDPHWEHPEIRTIRVQAWYRAVAAAYKIREQLSDEQVVTPGMLQRKFEGQGKNKGRRSGLWYKYASGEVVPRSSRSEEGRKDIALRVQDEYGDTNKWLNLPLWQLISLRPFSLEEIRLLYENLPTAIRNYFIDDSSTHSRFWKRTLNVKSLCEHLISVGDLDCLTALLIIIKETEATQDRLSYELLINDLIANIRTFVFPIEIEPFKELIYKHIKIMCHPSSYKNGEA